MISNIRDFKNWTEISKGYYQYAVAENVRYEIMTLRQGAENIADCNALYVSVEWKDQTNCLHFLRYHICNGSLEACLELAEKDFEADYQEEKEYDPIATKEEKEYDPIATKEDIETLEKFLARPDTNHTLKPKEAKSLVCVIIDIYKTVKEKKE